MTAFSLPWYAIVGAQKSVDSAIPLMGCLLLALVGPTAGRSYVDVTSGVTPKQFIRGEWFIGTALLTGIVWMLVFRASDNTWVAAGVAFLVGFSFRLLALYRGWEEPLAKEPDGVYQHSDGRPLLAASSRERHNASSVISVYSWRTKTWARPLSLLHEGTETHG